MCNFGSNSLNNTKILIASILYNTILLYNWLKCSMGSSLDDQHVLNRYVNVLLFNLSLYLKILTHRIIYSGLLRIK